MTKNNAKADVDVLEFARTISMLPTAENTPVSTKFDSQHGQHNNVWYKCQREHLCVWALHYPTPGVPGFTHTPSTSARKLYYSFGRPETLLWLAEASGCDNTILQGIVDQITPLHARTACKYIRQAIPFETILTNLGL